MKTSEAAALLKSADNILIVTHKNPDGDTIGSACALCHALRRSGKSAFLYRNAEVNDRLKPYCEKYFADTDFIPKFIVATDVAAPDMPAKGASFEYDLVIDHHLTNPEYGRNNCINSQKSACGEIILEIIQNINGNIDKEEANLLYIAISTDTGCFQYANTNADTFEAASVLMKCGAENNKINTVFFRKASMSRIMLEGMIYENMKYYHEDKVVVATITQKMLETCHTKESDLEDIASLSNRLNTGIIGITIRENPDGSSKISVRSGDEINAGKLCSYFGGGGHKEAAGCTIEADVEKAEKLIIEVLDSLWTACC